MRAPIYTGRKVQHWTQTQSKALKDDPDAAFQILYTRVSLYLVLFLISFSFLSFSTKEATSQKTQPFSSLLACFMEFRWIGDHKWKRLSYRTQTSMTCLASDFYFLYVHSWYFRAMRQILAWYTKDVALYWKSTVCLLIRDLIKLLLVNSHQMCPVSEYLLCNYGEMTRRKWQEPNH